METPEAELSILITGDRRMRELNRQWRGRDAPTDVLSFPMEDVPPGDGPVILGDVVINADATARQADSIGHSFDDETTRLLVHGIVHLLGYDHELGRKEAAQMAAMERKVMRAVADLG